MTCRIEQFFFQDAPEIFNLNYVEKLLSNIWNIVIVTMSNYEAKTSTLV